jgi:D-serine deaminase-like pyridoxal phosphate-dependent protein
VLSQPGFAGVMAYAVPEARWLVASGFEDVYVAYPSVDRAALPVVRRPAPGFVTAFGGGYVASGPPGWSRVPTPFGRRDVRLVRSEGVGEVQTPLHGNGVRDLALGDRVWFRYAKAGEMCERFDALHLVSGDRLVETVPTYRGEGKNFG